MRRRDVLRAGLTAPLATCAPLGRPSWTLNYRIKIKVLADRQEFEGSSVFRSTYRPVPEGTYKAEHPHSASTRGEAVAVQLGARGVLIGALRQVAGIETDQGFSPHRPYALFPLLAPEEREWSEREAGEPFVRLAALRGERAAPAEMWPQFLHLTRPSDSTSVRFVTVREHRYEFSWSTANASVETALGPGAAILSVTVEMTEDAPTQVIDDIIPWVNSIKGAPNHPRFSIGRGMPLHERLQYKNFVVGGWFG